MTPNNPELQPLPPEFDCPFPFEGAVPLLLTLTTPRVLESSDLLVFMFVLMTRTEVSPAARAFIVNVSLLSRVNDRTDGSTGETSNDKLLVSTLNKSESDCETENLTF